MQKLKVEQLWGIDEFFKLLCAQISAEDDVIDSSDGCQDKELRFPLLMFNAFAKLAVSCPKECSLSIMLWILFKTTRHPLLRSSLVDKRVR